MADWQKFNFKGGPHLPTPLRSFLNFLRQFHLALYRNISRFFKYFFQIYIHYIYFFTFLSAGRILGTEGTKYEVFIFTGCLNLLCPTSNLQFFRLKWHSKQKPIIFGILNRGGLCMIHRFLSLFCTQPLQPQIFRVSKFKLFEAMQIQIWGYEVNKKL